jgi:sulfite exporter TauE/SafE/copper chaperone CopZ
VEAETNLIKLRIGGMTCSNCERRIEHALLGLAGVKSAKVSYRGGFAEIVYSPKAVSVFEVKAAVENAGYKVLSGSTQEPQSATRIAGLLVLIVALYVLLSQFGILNLLVPSQLAQTNMGLGMLFVVGLLTSVHCMAMCGGINLSQTVGKSGLAPTALYNLGRVISYTAVGFIVGALGSVISFTQTTQGILKLLAGVFMIIMGINMLGIFPSLRKLTLRLPHIRNGSKSPLIVGLLNGLMPCGPLQAMQLYALSTGSPIKGAISMLLFSLGTVPLMFGLGALSTVLSKKFAHKAMTVGAVLVVVLGLTMLSQGWGLSGISLPSAADNAASTGQTEVIDGEQVVRSTLQRGQYPAISVKAGIPVKWVIDAPKGSINGCNNALYIPEYKIEYTFKPGENVIEFTPNDAGTFTYSCWMGMIRSTITVTDEDS